jgi:PAS domain S-box-containing protein
VITEADPIDVPGPRIVYVNDAFARLTGFSREEAIGQSPRILQGPDTQRTELDRIRAALIARQPIRTEVINYTKSRQPYWLELDIVPIADEHGQMTHFAAIERDVTERKATQAAMALNEERFRVVAQATADVVWDLNLTDGSVWWNDGIRTLFGYDLSQLPSGRDFWIANIHDADRARVTAGMSAAIDGAGMNWQDEYRFLRADRSIAVVVDRGFVIRAQDGHPVRMVGSIVDVTEQRQLEEKLRQSQRMDAIGQLTGGIAHDFNNLLTIILGNGEMLAEALADNEALRSLAELTTEAAESAAELTSRLLAFARQQPLDPKPTDINRLLSNMEKLLRRSIGEHIDMRLVCDSALWDATVDAPQLESAILNLCINGRDVMPDSGILTIETTNMTRGADDDAESAREFAAGDYVMIAVTDNGTGMAPDVVAQVFEPFFTTKDVGKGSGLGLSMVFGFVKQSRGHIKIYSELGHGTTVKLYLPRAKSERCDADLAGPPSTPSGGTETVLLVEDNDRVRTHVRAQLEGLGYRVVAVRDGPAALDVLRQNAEIDLLFTDIVMPRGMNGRQVADAAQALRPLLRVLFTSGYPESAIFHHGRLDPGIHLLQKPYRRHDLALKVRLVLDFAT